MNTTNILAVAAVAAFWNVWLWYFERLSDRSDEPFGIIALITMVAVQFIHRGSERFRKPALVFVLVAACLYLLSIFSAPKILQALCALVSSVLFLNLAGKFKRLNYGDYFLLALSLPVVASLNFYLGYPLRLLVSQAAGVLLHIAGMSVVVQGTALSFGGQTVEIDAPCGGVKMLWLAAYIAATFCAFYRLPFISGLILTLISVAAALVANVLRVTSLFYVETGSLAGSGFAGAAFTGQEKLMHQGIGVFAFILVALVISFAAKYFIRIASACQNKPISQQENEKAPLPLSRQALFCSFILLALIAVLPLVSLSTAPFLFSLSPKFKEQKFPGWPDNFEGQKFVRQELSPAEKDFLAGFPGKAAIFSCGKNKVLLRWIIHESRQIHSASDCMRGLGYDVEYLPLIIDRSNSRWNHFAARRGKETLDIREHIYDASGKSWNDISAWYWSAQLGKTKPPWWSVTVISQ